VEKIDLSWCEEDSISTVFSDDSVEDTVRFVSRDRDTGIGRCTSVDKEGVKVPLTSVSRLATAGSFEVSESHSLDIAESFKTRNRWPLVRVNRKS
jgi:hypothetical protein